MILGTISYVDDEAGLQLIIDGEDEPTTKKYSYISSYVPEADDRVIIEEIGGSYVIMGKLITEFENSGLARKADEATSATNATNATNAENATNATTADNLKNGHTTYGRLVTNVQTQYVSSLGISVVTDVSTSGSHNFVYQGM